MYQRRVVGLALSLAAIVAILAGSLTRTWWTGEQLGGTTAVGLRSAETCETAADLWLHDVVGSGRECQTRSLRRWFRGELGSPRRYWDAEPRHDGATPGGFVALGTLALALALAAAGALAFAALATAARQAAARRLGTVAAVLAGVFVAVVLAFVIAAPASLGALRAGLGPVLALVGGALGMAGGLVVRRLDAPGDAPAAWLDAAVRAAAVRRAGVLLAIAGAAALVVTATTTRTWFRGEVDGIQARVGLRTFETCPASRSVTDDDELPGPLRRCLTGVIPGSVEAWSTNRPRRMAVFIAMGSLTWATGVAGTIALGLAALLVLLGQPVGGRVSIARVLIVGGGLFAVAAAAHVLARTGELEEVSIWLGPFVAAAGGLATAAAGVIVARWTAAVERAAAGAAPPAAPEPAPMDVAPVPVAATSPAIPACPACATPMLWVGARQAWVCTICKTRPERDG